MLATPTCLSLRDNDDALEVLPSMDCVLGEQFHFLLNDEADNDAESCAALVDLACELSPTSSWPNGHDTMSGGNQCGFGGYQSLTSAQAPSV